ncbi:MAG: P-loop containing nucleoside triphosphate hydrolase protein [Benniella sp.]|nr:MAG: P-loop containing nucleoside triphosphate hydrolase protein [Benniella sp.]
MGYPDEKTKSSGLYSSTGAWTESDSFQSDSRQPNAGYSGASPMIHRAATTSSAVPPLPSRPSSSIRRNATAVGGTVNGSSKSSQKLAGIKDDYRGVYADLCNIYKRKIRQLETTYNFERFHSAPLTDSDIVAKPMVLLLGQYSTGKTTFIKHLIDSDYPGSHIGVEPTTDRFVAVMNGSEPRVIPGNAAAVAADLPFRELDRFGQAFLSRFQVSQCPNPLLENMTLVDTPGILAGDKQRIERGYDFTRTIHWFAQRSDLILLFFDSHKLDISDEFKSSIMALKGQEEKVRVVLNKSDMVDQQQLMRVYGAMMWSLGKVIQTPEVVRVYLSSFWLQKPPNVYEDCRALLEKEQADLLKDLMDLPRNAAIRKVNEIVKRARLARVHAYIIGHLRKEMPAVFGKKSRQRELIDNLQAEFLKVQQTYNVPAGDFPNAAAFRQCLEGLKFENFAKMSTAILSVVDEALSVDLPKIMSRFPHHGIPVLDPSERNPFLSPGPFGSGNTNARNDIPPSYWHFSSVDKDSARPIFLSLNPVEGRINGSTARPYFMNTGLSVEILAKVWTLADWTGDGYLDEDEFAVAMHLIRAVENGGEGVLPTSLPQSMLP